MDEGRVCKVGIGIESSLIFGVGRVIDPNANLARETPFSVGRCLNARIRTVEPR